MGIGPLVAWRRASLRSLGKTFVDPVRRGRRDRRRAARARLRELVAPGLLTYTFSAFVAASIVLEFVRGRVRARSGASLPADLARNRRRYGGYIVHAAIVLLAIGIAGSSAYQTQREQILRPGQSMEAAGYTLTYTGLNGVKGPNYNGYRAQLTASGHGERFRLDPGRTTTSSRAPRTRRPSTTTRARSATSSRPPQLAGKHTTNIDLKVFVKPLVNLIWVAGFVFVAGALIAMWPDAVEQRRLAARYAAGAAPAGI